MKGRTEAFWSKSNSSINTEGYTCPGWVEGAKWIEMPDEQIDSIEAKHSITFMSKPDHNTINRFRGKRLQKTLQPIFTQVVLLSCDEGLLSLKDLYTDGAKVEANANRYSFVWDNSIKSNKAKSRKQLN